MQQFYCASLIHARRGRFVGTSGVNIGSIHSRASAIRNEPANKPANGIGAPAFSSAKCAFDLT
jgi:hypothetical protein